MRTILKTVFRNLFCFMEIFLLLIHGIAPANAASPQYIKCPKAQLVLRIRNPKTRKNPSGTTYRGQDSYVDKGVLFKFWTGGLLQMYDFKSGKLINECPVSGKHCSVATFIPKRSGYGRMFLETNDSTPTVSVNEMSGNRTKFQRSLKFPKTKYGYHMKHIVSTSGKTIYGISVKTGNRRSKENGNCMIITVWDTTKLTKNRDNTFTPRFVRSFNIPFIMFCQGMCFYKNKLYILSSDYINPVTKVYAIDINKRRISEVYCDFPSQIKHSETQGVFVDCGYLYIDAGMTIYRVAKIR